MSKNSDKISASSYVDYEKAKPSYGKMREQIEIIAELPPVGSIVELYETVYRSRNLIRNGQCLRDYKIPVTDGLSEKGGVRQFKVMGYSKGENFPLDASNHMLLRYYDPQSGNLGWSTTVSARQISVGVVTVIVVEE